MNRLARMDRRYTVPIAAGAVVLAALVLVAAAVATGGSDENASSARTDGSVVPSVSASVAAAAAQQANLPTSDAPLARLVIPAIGIDQAPIEGQIDTQANRMVEPPGAFDIAYYRIENGGVVARPGKGNLVFSGHVDYVNVGPAAFWNLRKLKEGDDLLLRLGDGLELRYKVTFNVVYAADNGPWDQLFLPDAMPDAVTLYTCDGEFDRRTQSYDQRRVVRAIRVG